MIARNMRKSTSTSTIRRSARLSATWNFTSARNSEGLQRLIDRSLIPHVQTCFRAVNLPHQSEQNFSGANLDESLHAVFNQQLHALQPLHRTGDLCNKGGTRPQFVGDEGSFYVAYHWINRLLRS